MACCGLLNLSPYFSIASSSYSAPRPTNRKLVTTTTPRTWTVTAISAATFAFIPRLCRLSLSLSSFLSPPPYLLMPPMPPSSSSIYRGRHSGRRRQGSVPCFSACRGVVRGRSLGLGSFKKLGEWLPPQLRNF